MQIWGHLNDSSIDSIQNKEEKKKKKKATVFTSFSASERYS